MTERRIGQQQRWSRDYDVLDTLAYLVALCAALGAVVALISQGAG